MNTSSPLRFGLIGCGAISNAYFAGLKPFAALAQITACADLDVARARQKADEQGIATACSVDELLADPDVDAILNLTIPAAHAAVNLRAIQAGKHAYCEKPFALSYKEGLRVLKEAQKRKLRVGCAPDTMLGGGIQTCAGLVAAGAIGRPISATANMLCPGHESWHPNPEFYYQEGGGPLFDMGPYYLTALVAMLGPAKSVAGFARTTCKERLITSQPLKGTKIKVKTPTHIGGWLEFGRDVVATVNMSFDVHAHHLPLLEVYGTEGTLRCPDPNHFNGVVEVWTTTTREWREVALTHRADLGRGIGLADMAHSLRHRRAHRLSGELGLHVVEMMEGFLHSSKTGRKLALKSTCRQPVPLPEGLAIGQLD